jgi:hypothetical protein
MINRQTRSVQVAIRLPAETLGRAEQIVTARRKLLKSQGDTYQASRIMRSEILRQALELGLLQFANELKPSKPARAKKKPAARLNARPRKQ